MRISRRARTYLLIFACVAASGAGAGWYLYTARPEYRLGRAQEAIRAGDSRASELAAVAFELDGYPDQAALVRGELMLRRGEASHHPADLAAAVRLLNQVRPESGLGRDAVCLSGRALLGLGNLVQAERAFSFVLSQDPDFVDAHRGLMAVYYDLGALTYAVRHAEKWAELAPRDGRPHRFLGLIYKDMSQCQRAVEPYRAALARALTPTVQKEVKVELAECLIHLGQYAEAQADLESVGPSAELVAPVLTLQAECARELGNAEDARALVAQAVAAHPTHTAALRLRAQLALDAGAVGPALADLERAAALAPSEFETQHLLAQVYTQQGQPQKAAAAQARVTEIQGYLDDLTKATKAGIEHPRDAAVHQRMADLFLKLGMPERAAVRRRIAASLAAAVSHPSVAAPGP